MQIPYEDRVAEPWASWLVEAGYVMGNKQLPNRADLAKDIGVSASTIAKLMDPNRSRSRGPNASTIERVAKALGRPVQEVAAAVGVQWEESSEWVLPEQAKLLNMRERVVIEQVILAMAAAKRTAAEPARKRGAVVGKKAPQRKGIRAAE